MKTNLLEFGQNIMPHILKQLNWGKDKFSTFFFLKYCLFQKKPIFIFAFVHY